MERLIKLVGPFPGHVTPTRPGVYRVMDPERGYALWTGEEWRAVRWSAAQAARCAHGAFYQLKRWYGLPKPATQST